MRKIEYKGYYIFISQVEENLIFCSIARDEENEDIVDTFRMTGNDINSDETAEKVKVYVDEAI